MGQVVGEGGFGIVRLVTHNTSGEKLAVKIIKKARLALVAATRAPQDSDSRAWPSLQLDRWPAAAEQCIALAALPEKERTGSPCRTKSRKAMPRSATRLTCSPRSNVRSPYEHIQNSYPYGMPCESRWCDRVTWWLHFIT